MVGSHFVSTRRFPFEMEEKSTKKSRYESLSPETEPEVVTVCSMESIRWKNISRLEISISCIHHRKWSWHTLALVTLLEPLW